MKFFQSSKRVGKRCLEKRKKKSKRAVEKTKQGKEKSGRVFIFWQQGINSKENDGLHKISHGNETLAISTISNQRQKMESNC